MKIKADKITSTSYVIYADGMDVGTARCDSEGDTLYLFTPQDYVYRLCGVWLDKQYDTIPNIKKVVAQTLTP